MQLARWTTIITLSLCMMMLLTRRRKPVLHHPDEDRYRYSELFIFLFAATLIFFEGFRHGYADTGNYRGAYATHPSELSLVLKDPAYGFGLIMWLLRFISKEPQFFLIVVAAFITITDVEFIKKYSSDLFFSLVLYFFFSFLENMNGLRQIIAACIMMLAFPWVLQRKTVPYLLLIVLLSTIHRSILVVIPLYFVFSGKRWNKLLVLFEIGCVFSVIVPGPINFLIGRFFEEDYAKYVIGGEVYDATANILHVFIDGVPLVLGLIYHFRNKDDIGGNRVYDVLINMQAIYFGFMVLATTMAQYARIGMYMRNSTALLTPFLIRKVFTRKDAETIKVIAIVLYFVVFLSELFISNSSGYFRVLYLDFSIFK